VPQPRPQVFGDGIDDPGIARIVNAFMVEFALRYMREAAQLFDDDYVCAMIFLAVLEANGRHNIRQPYFLDDYSDARVSLPAELARPVSRKAISESLGLPRETVRRKVSSLVKQGFLVEDERGGVITARDVISREAFLAAQQRAIGYLRQLNADLRRYAAGSAEA
jgi:hypothetical protein